MPASLPERYRRLGRVERAFLLALPLSLALEWLAPASGMTGVFAFIAWLLGVVVLVRLARTLIHRMLWRLRNRLIVAYLFIAVVPIVLIVLLFGITTYAVTGQIAGYLINSELQRRTAALRRPAEALVRVRAASRAALARRIMHLSSGSFPQLTLIVRDGTTNYVLPQEEAPPAAWKDAHGIIARGGRLYSWAHAENEGADVTLLAPLTRDFMASLVPGLGPVDLAVGTARPGTGPAVRVGDKALQPGPGRGEHREAIPPPFMPGDLQVTGVYPVPYSLWTNPGESENAAIIVQTRISAVLSQVFGHNVILEKLEWGEAVWLFFLGLSGLFLVVELVSLVIGISLSRTITAAVHQLYEGTLRVKEGDFSHRIPVKGNDQVAELAQSFNTMTANLERLIVVAKEKERLQSELEIAREVQAQLFPKEIPDLRNLQMAGVCNPARMVSGDYYDFMRLPDARLAFAIGDVAGKGISAALLMAAIQSTMRTQLNTVQPMAAAAGNGGRAAPLSTARLVSLLNTQLYANTSPEKYATFYFALYDDESGRLTYTNAGHVPPILLRAGRPQLMNVTGTVVGAFPFAQYEEESVQLQPGDVLVTYTDGIVEPENEYGEMYGEERLKEVLCKWAGAPCDEMIARTMEAVNQWTGAGELQDDMTMLVARRV